MPSEKKPGSRSWGDPRYFLSLLMPLGALVWLGETIFLSVLPFIYVRGAVASEANKIAIVILSVMGVFVGLYYTVALYQVLFLELKERFIVRKAHYQDEEFDLKGYYFKTDSFKVADVVAVEEVVADPRWFSKRTGTMLTRNPKVRYNFSLKATLKDGRAFYFPGEMFQQHGIDELRGLLESGIQAQRG